MTIAQFKKVARALKEAYKELEKEALLSDTDIFSDEYKQAQDILREEILNHMGFTLEEYRKAKEQYLALKTVNLDETSKARIAELFETHIPTEEEITAIAKSNIPAPKVTNITTNKITNKIVKETTKVVEKPIKETIYETYKEEYDPSELLTEIKHLNEKIDKIKVPTEDELKELIETTSKASFKNNINLLGMPDFRKLAMGLQAQIDSITTPDVAALWGGITGTLSNQTDLQSALDAKADDLSGTINEIAYFDSASTIASLPVATYPSLTELSYVKGLTSPAQTQIDAKQDDLTLTTTGSSGASTLIGATLNVPEYTLTGLGGATTALDNLASVAINASLLPGTSDAVALGSTSKYWSDLFLADGGVINWNNNLTLTHSSGKLALVGQFQSSGNIGIGGVAPSASRGIYSWSGNVSDTSGTEYAGSWNLVTPTNSSASSASFRGIKADVNCLATGDINTSAKQVVGVLSDVRDSGSGSGTTGELAGFATTAYSNTSRTITSLFGLYSRVGLASSGNVGTAYGVYVSMFETGAGAMTNAYGLYVESVAGMATTNNYGIYLVSGASYLNGLVQTQNIEPISDDGGVLGSATKRFSDLFLAEGAVINWDNGDLTLTQTGNTLALAGGGLDIQGSLQVDSVTNDTGLAHGTYTPTVSSSSNLDASPTMSVAQYTRVGNTVTVSGSFLADASAAGLTSFEMDLPVASNFTVADELAGTGASVAGETSEFAEALGEATNNKAVITWIAVDTEERRWSYHFTYLVV